MLSPAAPTAVPITARDQQNKLPTKNSLKAFHANPSYPSGLPMRRMGKHMGKLPGLEMGCPFPVIQPPTVLPKRSLPRCHSCGPPSTYSFALHPESQQHLCPTGTAGNAAGKAIHSPVDCAAPSLPRLQPVQAMSWDNLAQTPCSSCARYSSEGTSQDQPELRGKEVIHKVTFLPTLPFFQRTM